jgi:dihydrolipoamide dehydrogenase
MIARSGLLGGSSRSRRRGDRGLRAAGVEVRCAPRRGGARDAATGTVTVTRRGRSRHRDPRRDGRVPRTDDVGLETVGLEPGAWLDVDDTMRVRGSDWPPSAM